MNIQILRAELHNEPGEGFVGKVEFEVTGHKQAYEMTLHSEKGKSWSYGLFFLRESGPEEEIEQVEEYLEDNDEVFEMLIENAKAALK